MIECKRIYQPPAPQDGVRILVERLWPRGVRRESAAVDHWLKEIAPSPDLRRWFGHDPERWEEFRSRYCRELDTNPQAVDRLLELADRDDLTLVYAARDEPGNSALVLREYLLARLGRERPSATRSP